MQSVLARSGEHMSALNHVVYVDDVQIVRGSFEKRYSSQAGVTIQLESIEAEAG